MRRSTFNVQLLCLFILAAGCGRKSVPETESKLKDELPVIDSTTAGPGVLTIEDSLLVLRTEPHLVASLKHTACYGRCPVYEVQFYSNGQALYKGEQNVTHQGLYLAYVPDSTVHQILQKAQSISFFSLSDFYPVKGAPIADLPQTITYLNDGRQEKSITNNHLAPIGLIAFERFLDKLALEIEWQPKLD